MSELESRVNRKLRALGEAYQEGRLDRAAYRARRRGVLDALRVQDEAITGNETASGRMRDDVSSVLFVSRWQSPRLRLAAMLAGFGVLAVVMVWFASGDAHGW